MIQLSIIALNFSIPNSLSGAEKGPPEIRNMVFSPMVEARGVSRVNHFADPGQSKLNDYGTRTESTDQFQFPLWQRGA